MQEKLRRSALHGDEHGKRQPAARPPARRTSTGAGHHAGAGLASGRPSALVDWNNNYGDDPDKAVVFHCSNLPKEHWSTTSRAWRHAILGKRSAERTPTARSSAACARAVHLSARLYRRQAGWIRAYLGEGEFTNDPLETFGGYGVVRVPRCKSSLAYICENGFEHHVAVNQTRVAAVLDEALVSTSIGPCIATTKWSSA